MPHWLFLTPREADTVRAAMALLVPGSEEADAVRYADRLLGAFAVEPPLVYASGRPDGSFLPLTPAQRTGWRRRVAELGRVYRAGAGRLDRRAGGCFAGAPPAARHRALDAVGADFRDLLFDHAVEGTYGDPVYRGRPAPAGPAPLPAPALRGTGPSRRAPVTPYEGPGPDPVALLARHFTEAARLLATTGGYGG
ncbi:hypothetical protein [Streptomyces sp. CRN 30]|uniref:hypothetical protein n=1 Tax=Streptomyces sp. CRN 30 TaxID=3075613 RepID=UPI002A824379|nr:hypothetical protein [Streptomyces sp. CRN 30]